MNLYGGFRFFSSFGALILFCCIFTVASLNSDWTNKKFPSPKINPEFCGGAENETEVFVCDPDRILKADEFVSLNKLIKQFHDSIRTKCRCPKSCEKPAEPAIFLSFAIVKEIQFEKFPSQAARRFALKLLEDPAWEFGPCENALIGVAAVNPPVLWLEGKIF